MIKNMVFINHIMKQENYKEEVNYVDNKIV
jgi:hypothetical protein